MVCWTLFYISCSQHKSPPYDSSMAREDATISSQCYSSCTGVHSQLVVVWTSTCLPGWLLQARVWDRPTCSAVSQCHDVQCRGHETAILPASVCGTTCHYLCGVNPVMNSLNNSWWHYISGNESMALCDSSKSTYLLTFLLFYGDFKSPDWICIDGSGFSVL